MIKPSFTLLALLLIFNGCGEDTTSSPAATYSVGGTMTYDYIPVSSLNNLDYENSVQKPIRGAKVCIANTSTCTYTDDTGAYSFPGITLSSVQLYVYAQTDTITVEDNTNGDAVYVMATDTINTAVSQTYDFNAPSGWTGSNTAGSYTSSRVAAPFAILDSLYQVQKAFETADTSLSFPQLKVNWSIYNIAADGDKTLGNIITSHWDGSELYILGKADSDTDEYDAGVMIHEWGHYFEDSVSRSDSIGGSHSDDEIKDIRLAFGEGWGTAVSGMMLDDHTYRDTFGTKQQTGFSQDLEAESDTVNPGWFSERSIRMVLYDIYDSTDDAGDTVSLGLAPIIQVMTNAQVQTEAFTSIFSFMTALKAENPGSASALDTLTASHSIDAVADIYGSTETHDGGNAANLSVYKSITKGGGDLNVTMAGFSGINNDLENNRYITFTGDGATTTVTATTADDDGDTIPDEDIVLYVYQKGILKAAVDNVYLGSESVTIPTTNGAVYIIVVRGINQNDLTYTATVNVN